MSLGLYVTTMQVTVSVAVMQLEVSAEHIQVTVSAANMGDTFYGNYASNNVCCIFAGFDEVVFSVTVMLVDLSVTVMQVTISVAIMQLEVLHHICK